MLDILAVILDLTGNYLNRLDTSPGGNRTSSWGMSLRRGENITGAHARVIPLN